VDNSSAVRRLCVCVGAPFPGLLDRACRAGGFGRLYTERFGEAVHLPVRDVELGFASPGVDEASLICDLIAALRAESAKAAEHVALTAPVLAAFHVGITRVEGDGLRGSAVTRIVGLLRDLAPAAGSSATLIVGISASLFGDLSPDADLGGGWLPLRGAEAVFCAF
jgi:hypothetical protein